MTGCSLACIIFCYRISFGWLLFCGIAGYSLQHVEYVGVNEIFALGLCPQILGNIPVYIAVIVCTYAVLCLCAAFVFRPKLKALGDIPFAKKPVALCFYSLLLAMLIASAFMAQLLFFNGGGKPVSNPNYVAGIADIFNCVFVLIRGPRFRWRFADRILSLIRFSPIRKKRRRRDLSDLCMEKSSSARC